LMVACEISPFRAAPTHTRSGQSLFHRADVRARGVC
jgi:hypothetical protein